MKPTLEQIVSLQEEVRTSILLIIEGLRMLQSISGTNDFFHIPMLLLASGIERLMKTVICYHYLNDKGTFPKVGQIPLRKKGHDLEYWLEQITEKCFSESYLSDWPAARTDIEFLKKDKHFKEMISILSQFGQSARYHNLDVVLQYHPIPPSPDTMWNRLEASIMDESENNIQRLKNGKINDEIETVVFKLVIRIEKLVKAFANLIITGKLGVEAANTISHFKHFISLPTSQLGKTKY